MPKLIEPAYYVTVFTPTSWRLFLAAGGTTAGFPSTAWTRVARLKPGDYLLCYLVEVKQWIGLVRVTGEPYSASEPPIWGTGAFPARVPVEVVKKLPEDASVSAKDLIEKLPRLKKAAEKHPGAWSSFVRGSPRRWSSKDAEVVINAIREAQSSLGQPG
jgi:hypothetical protein